VEGVTMTENNDNVNHRLVGKYLKGEEKSNKNKKGNELPKVNQCCFNHCGKTPHRSGCQ
jgi:hypothetical protein